MKITARSSLKKVAAVVSDALSGAGIRAVLTRGACATIYSGGAYQSEDLDLILQSSPCRDRLAAYYHWQDRQSLKAAVAVAARHHIDLDRTRSWSAREGATQGFDEFVEEVRKARARRRR